VKIIVNCPNKRKQFNPLNTELNPIGHLLALLGAHHILHVSGLRVKLVVGNKNEQTAEQSF